MSGVTVVAFSAQGQAAANGVHAVKLPLGATLVGVTVYPESFSGTPTGFDVDIQAGGSDVVTALAANTSGTPAAWLSTHLGGDHAPVALAANALVEVDVNLTGGTAPKADYDIQLWLLMGTV